MNKISWKLIIIIHYRVESSQLKFEYLASSIKKSFEPKRHSAVKAMKSQEEI